MADKTISREAKLKLLEAMEAEVNIEGTGGPVTFKAVADSLNRTVVDGARSGIEATIGSLGDVEDLMQLGISAGDQWARHVLGMDPIDANERARRDRIHDENRMFPNTSEVRDFTENTMGIPRPQAPVNEGEKMFHSGAEFGVGGMAAGGKKIVENVAEAGLQGSLAKNARLAAGTGAIGAAGGVASEGAGQLFEGTKLEPAARLLAAVLGTTVAGLPGAIRGKPSSELRRALQGIPADKLDDAATVLSAARSEGVPMLGLEAISGDEAAYLRGLAIQVAGGTGGRKIVETLSGREEALKSLIRRRAVDVLGKPLPTGQTASAVKAAAEASIKKTKDKIDNTTGPMFESAIIGSDLPISQYRQLMKNHPSLRSVLGHVRRDAILKDRLQQKGTGGKKLQKINSFRTLDELRKETSHRIDKLLENGDTNRAALLLEAMDALTTSMGAVNNAYKLAIDEHAALSAAWLDPLVKGPVGKMVAAEKIQTQLKHLADPDSVDPGEVRQTMRDLAVVNVEAPRYLVQQHLMQTLNKASVETLSGSTNVGGRFVKSITPTDNSRKNLKAAFEELAVLQGLPKNEYWSNFTTTMQILKASSSVPGLAKGVKSGGAVGRADADTAVAVARGGILDNARRKLGTYLIEKDFGKLSDILTDPNSLEQFKKIKAGKANGKAARLMLINLLGINKITSGEPE